MDTTELVWYIRRIDARNRKLEALRQEANG
jgi:hypothetical protein